MRKVLILCLFAFCFAFAEKQRFIVLDCITNYDSENLESLRNKVEEVARKTLPVNDFILKPYSDLREEVGDSAINIATCDEEGKCYGDLLGQINVDYGMWCQVSKYKSKLNLSFKILHNISASEKNLIFIQEYKDNPKDINDMKLIIEREVPIAIKEKMLGISVAKEPVKIGFWTGIGLEVLGAVFLYAGYDKNKEYDKKYDEYKALRKSSDYDSAWEKAEEAKKSRNLFYILGGVSIAAGVPLWVF